jgi:hypothetical protein
MRRRIFWIVAAVPTALIFVGVGVVLPFPVARHAVSGLWNLPDRLPALSANRQVHYEPGMNFIEFRLEKAPPYKPQWYPIVMAYRQAGMFVTYLRDSDRPAFDLMMKAILDGRPFAEAVTAGYHTDAPSLWLRFVQVLAGRE